MFVKSDYKFIVKLCSSIFEEYDLKVELNTGYSITYNNVKDIRAVLYNHTKIKYLGIFKNNHTQRIIVLVKGAY